MKRDKKDEEAGGANPFLHLDKTTVLQEVSICWQMAILNLNYILIANKLFLTGEDVQ